MTQIGAMYRPISDILRDFNAPVNPAIISQKPVFSKGQQRGSVSYIHWYDLVSELHRICPGWSWQIRTQFLPDRCVVEGRLTVRAQEGEFFMEATGVEPLDSNGYGDPVYSAEASALRRSMSKFGYALDLWRKDKRSQKSEVSREPQVVQNSQPTTQNSRLISQKQIALLYAIAKNESGLGEEDIKLILAKFGYASSKDIPTSHFDAVLNSVKEAGQFINREQYKELVSFCKQRGIPNSVVTQTLTKCGYSSCGQILRTGLNDFINSVLQNAAVQNLSKNFDGHVCAQNN